MSQHEDVPEYRPWRLTWGIIAVLLVMLLLAIYSVSLISPQVGTTPSSSEARGASNALAGETFNIYLVADPFAQSFLQARRKLEKLGDLKLNIVINNSYDNMYKQTILNSKDRRSAYDLVSIDIVWVGEFAKDNVLLELDELIARDKLDTSDYLPIAYQQGSFNSKQYALPLQPHTEMLWYRKDLFASAGLQTPKTSAELLRIAAQLHQPDEKMYGICWNAQRGVPLGQTMAHFYGAFGQSLLDARGLPQLDTDKGVEAARFALELLKYSPPDILQMAWTKRIERFAAGQAAMTYGWTARSFVVEEDEQSLVKGKVGYTAAPHDANAKPVTPVGTWSLGIPANIGTRKDKAWRLLKWLTSKEVLSILAKAGNGGVPRVSLLSNPDLVARYPSFAPIKELSDKKQLQDWMRPPVPEWSGLCQILGNVYHDMLLGELTPEAAAKEAQRQAMELFTQ